MENIGYVHVYTGNGKGKSTAAFGLALRAIYAGKKVYIGQFVKSMKYHEVNIEKDLDNIKIEQYGRTCFINEPPQDIDHKMAKDGLSKIANIMKSGEVDVVILDEVFIAVYMNFFTDIDLIHAIESRAENVEVICTGRYAPDSVIAIADVVTEMKEVKHYYKEGVMARDGIER